MSYGQRNQPWERSVVRYDSEEAPCVSNEASAQDWHKWATLGLGVLETVGRHYEGYEDRKLRNQEIDQRERKLKLRQEQVESQNEAQQRLERQLQQQERLLQQLQLRLEQCERKLQEQECRLHQQGRLELDEGPIRQGKGVTMVSQRVFAKGHDYDY